MKECSVVECKNKHHAKGYCSLHFNRVRRHGDPGPVNPYPKVEYSERITPQGYVEIRRRGTQKLQHVEVAEKAIGKELPKGSQVHHINKDKADNRPENLVICPDQKYHLLLHVRMRAMEACGNPNWIKCQYCGEYDSLKNIYINPSNGEGRHRSCFNQKQNEWRLARA